MKKRILIFTLAALLAVMLFAVTALAGEPPTHGFTVTKADGSAAAGSEIGIAESAPTDVDYYWQGNDLLYLIQNGLMVSGNGADNEQLFVGNGDYKVSSVTFQGLSTNNTIFLNGPEGGLTLTLEGENQIGCAVSKPDFGIKFSSKMVVTGNGNLTIFDEFDGILPVEDPPVASPDLTFDANFTGTLTILDEGAEQEEPEPEPPCAISIGAGTLTVNGGTLNLVSKEKNAITAGTVSIGSGLVVYAGDTAEEVEKKANTYYTQSSTERIVYIAMPHFETVGENNLEFTPWVGNTTLPATAGDYYLVNDVTLDATWSVPAGTTNLCLNGYAIKANATETNPFSVIKVDSGATLNLYDCDTETKHYFTKDTTTGLWTLAADQTAPTDYSVTGGVITGGSNSGVYVEGNNSGNGTFTMYGGNIVGNTATTGGGVSVIATTGANNEAFESTFNMIGGTIRGNTALGVIMPIMNIHTGGFGGGVCVNGIGGKFNMTGGEIGKNTADNVYGGGVYFSGGTITLGGTAKITGNTLADGTTASNLYLPNNKTFALGTGTDAPQNGMQVGVTMQTPGVFTVNAADGYKDYFHAENTGYSIICTADKKLKMVLPHSVTAAPVPANGTVVADKSSNVFEGETVTVTVNPAEGYQLKSLSYNDGTSDTPITKTGGVYSFTMPDKNVTITAEFKYNGSPYIPAPTDQPNPDTGDTSNISLGVILMIASSLGAAACLTADKKRRSTR